MLRRWSLPVAALCALLAMSGCTDDPEPNFADPTSESSPTPSSAAPMSEPPSPEPTNPAPSPTAPVDTLSPESTVRAWVDALNVLLSSGRSDEFRQLSTPPCDQCNQLLQAVRSTYQAGARTETEGWTIRQLRRTERFARDGRMAAEIAAAESVLIERDGTRTRTAPTAFNLEVILMQYRGSWRVDEWGYL